MDEGGRMLLLLLLLVLGAEHRQCQVKFRVVRQLARGEEGGEGVAGGGLLVLEVGGSAIMKRGCSCWLVEGGTILMFN